jgi:hypothetical protein
VNSTRLKKSNWRNGIWVTRVAAVFGLAAICVGMTDPRLFHIKALALLAMGAIALSIAGIGISLYQLDMRSRRLRMPVFWLSLAANLILIAAVGFLYARGMGRPEYPQGENGSLENDAAR